MPILMQTQSSGDSIKLDVVSFNLPPLQEF